MNSMIQASMPDKQDLLKEMKAIQSNPVQYLLNKNLDIPNNIANNPQAIINWLVESGQRTPQQVAQARQMLGI